MSGFPLTGQQHRTILAMRLRASENVRAEQNIWRKRLQLTVRHSKKIPVSGFPLTGQEHRTILAVHFRRLGERESGTKHLEEAVAAYREALKESTRERVPLDWAGTQNNLGNALLRARENVRAEQNT